MEIMQIKSKLKVNCCSIDGWTMKRYIVIWWLNNIVDKIVHKVHHWSHYSHQSVNNLEQGVCFYVRIEVCIEVWCRGVQYSQ